MSSKFQLGDIGAFQLENLVKNKVSFELYGIDLKPGEIDLLPEPQKSWVQRLVIISHNDLDKKKWADPMSPIVLLCQDGRVSRKFADRLHERGMQNVYVMVGGIVELIKL